MAVTAIVAYLGAALWTLRVSLSSSRSLPKWDFVGLAQYARLFHNDRWLLSLENLALYGLLFVLACLVIGFLLAVLIDREVAGPPPSPTYPQREAVQSALERLSRPASAQPEGPVGLGP